jgi:uncharacterized membrane protein YebE (DUF533 family)
MTASPSNPPIADPYKTSRGVAIATAMADGEVHPKEREVIEQICEQVGLPDDKRALVDEMLVSPPDAKQIARWTETEDDRIAVYAVGLRVAEADDKMRLQEAAVLDRLRRYLSLDPDQITKAKQRAAEARL